MKNMKKKIQPIEPTAVYTVAQAARVLNVTPQTVRNWIRDGRLPHGPKQAGFHRRFTGRELLECIERREGK